jgi:hypothetical protein
LWGQPVSEVRRGGREDREDKEDKDKLEHNDEPVETSATVAEGPYVQAGAWCREWTLERLSQIIRRECVKGIDAKLGISSWRNIIEAIGQRFL